MTMSYRVIENFDVASDWTVFGNDTINKAASEIRLWGAYSLEFDKTDGAANTTIAGVYKTFTYVDPFKDMTPLDRIGAVFYVSSLTDVAYAFIRIGSSAANYVEYRILDSNMQAGWNCLSRKIGDCFLPTTTTGFAVLGNTDPTYIAVGVVFDAQDKALADIKFDSVFVAKNERTVS